MVVHQHRERTIERLCAHFAQDHLEAEELEQRIDRAHQAASAAELDALLAGLPALDAAPSPDRSRLPTRPVDRQQIVATFGRGAERRGRWAPSTQLSVVAVMGGVVLDFREAQLTAGVTDVNVLAVMGGVQIVVPPGLHVDSSGIDIMGGFEQVGAGRFPVDSSAPVLRIRGVALLGGVEIEELGPGEGRQLQRGEPRDGSGWVGGPRR